MKRNTGGAGVRQVPLTGIRESKLNPRRLFSPVEIEELASSIKKHGIIQPLVVRQVKGAFELIAGARRLRAAAIAKLTTVPVVVREASDDEVLELMLVENLQRADLNAVDECEGYWQLVEERHYTATRIAESIGKSISYVTTRMKLRELAPEARAALADGRIAASHAILLAREPVAAQRKALKIRTENQGPSQMTVGDIKRALKPTVQHRTPAGTVSDVVTRCWKCSARLEFDSDGMGGDVVRCPQCLKRWRELEDQVRRLKRDLEAAQRKAAA